MYYMLCGHNIAVGGWPGWYIMIVRAVAVHTLTQVKVDIFSLSVRWSPVVQDPTTQRSTLLKWWVVILQTWQRERERERERAVEFPLSSESEASPLSLFKFLLLLTFLDCCSLSVCVCVCVCVCVSVNDCNFLFCTWYMFACLLWANLSVPKQREGRTKLYLSLVVSQVRLYGLTD